MQHVPVMSVQIGEAATIHPALKFAGFAENSAARIERSTPLKFKYGLIVAIFFSPSKWKFLSQILKLSFAQIVCACNCVSSVKRYYILIGMLSIVIYKIFRDDYFASLREYWTSNHTDWYIKVVMKSESNKKTGNPEKEARIFWTRRSERFTKAVFKARALTASLRKPT